MKKKVIVAITGASGSIYASLLLDELEKSKDLVDTVLLMSKNAETVWQLELGNKDFKKYPFSQYAPDDFFSPTASGSAGFDSMVVCPCSMGTLGRIANGISDDLITRSADVMLKEKKQLILVPRETPFSSIHLQNMLFLSNLGVTILPANPSFYSRPSNIKEMAFTVVSRILDHLNLPHEGFRWGEND
jgi:4-hydroxy-3-polyprenylbenzoate decarboxylase